MFSEPIVTMLLLLIDKLFPVKEPKYKKQTSSIDLEYRYYRSLIGKTGIVQSPLRPVGKCEFEDKRIVCVADTGYIEKETRVKVIHVEGNKVTVRKLNSN